MSELDPTSTDAMHWAEQVVAHVEAQGKTTGDLDAEWLHGWFANYWAAIHDTLQQQLQARDKLVQEAYLEGWSEGVSDGHPLSARVTGARRWDESGAKDSLEALQEQQR